MITELGNVTEVTHGSDIPAGLDDAHYTFPG